MAHLANIDAVRIILSLTTYFHWELQQFDSKNAFLHRHLEEKVYVKFLKVLRLLKKGMKCTC